jgi:hypothetical protein
MACGWGIEAEFCNTNTRIAGATQIQSSGTLTTGQPVSPQSNPSTSASDNPVTSQITAVLKPLAFILRAVCKRPNPVVFPAIILYFSHIMPKLLFLACGQKEPFLKAPEQSEAEIIKQANYNDLEEIYYRNGRENDLIAFFKSQLSSLKDNYIVQGNLNFYLGKIYFATDKKAAHQYFATYPVCPLE